MSKRAEELELAAYCLELGVFAGTLYKKQKQKSKITCFQWPSSIGIYRLGSISPVLDFYGKNDL
jgi:hypothetical protein